VREGDEGHDEAEQRPLWAARNSGLASDGVRLRLDNDPCYALFFVLINYLTNILTSSRVLNVRGGLLRYRWHWGALMETGKILWF
jgi:hypothetical protein